MNNIRCGTRGSQLALAQTQLVIDAIEKEHNPLKVERHIIKTLGDRKQGTPLASQSDKKDWVIDLELALLNNEIDFAVHSSKDIPYEIEIGTTLLPVLSRGNPFDAFVGRKISEDGKRLCFSDLPQGAKVGTASLRRRAYLLKKRPDLQVIEHRGNLPTRLQKMDDSEDIMGIILASAGLERLNIPGLVYETLAPELMLPALNQGTLSVQLRENDQTLHDIFKPLIDLNTHATWIAERRVAELLEGDCKSAIAIFAETSGNTLSLSASVMLADASDSINIEEKGNLEAAKEIGEKVGQQLLERGAKELIEKSHHMK